MTIAAYINNYQRN